MAPVKKYPKKLLPDRLWRRKISFYIELKIK